MSEYRWGDVKATHHQDGSISIRVTPSTLRDLEGGMATSVNDWHRLAQTSKTPDLDTRIAKELEATRRQLWEILHEANLR